MKKEKLGLRELKLPIGTLLVTGLGFKAHAPFKIPQAVRVESTWPMSGVNRRPRTGRGGLDLVYVSTASSDSFDCLLGILLSASSGSPARLLGTNHILRGYRKVISIFPEKILTELCITVFMSGALSSHLGQSACSPPTLPMPLTGNSRASLEPWRQSVPG